MYPVQQDYIMDTLQFLSDPKELLIGIYHKTTVDIYKKNHIFIGINISRL